MHSQRSGLVILEDTSELAVSGNRLASTPDDVPDRDDRACKIQPTCPLPIGLLLEKCAMDQRKNLLDAWITGHPGGCATIHGEDADKALERLSDLAREGGTRY